MNVDPSSFVFRDAKTGEVIYRGKGIIIDYDNLTKKAVVYLHRQLWNFIADHSEIKKRCVGKPEAFQFFMWPRVKNYCWCCEYAEKNGKTCASCPINWSDNIDFYNLQCQNGRYGLYYLWMHACLRDDYKSAAKLAREIANLPERN